MHDYETVRFERLETEQRLLHARVYDQLAATDGETSPRAVEILIRSYQR